MFGRLGKVESRTVSLAVEGVNESRGRKKLGWRDILGVEGQAVGLERNGGGQRWDMMWKSGVVVAVKGYGWIVLG